MIESREVPIPGFTSGLRYRLILGKFRVTAISTGLTGFKATLALPGSVTMTIDIPLRADVKLGDLLTLYTEVLANDQPNPTPIQ